MAELDQENNVETESDQSEVSIDNLKVLENIEVKLTVEVGSSQLKIRDLLRLNEGSVVELERLAGDPLDILANGVQIARGEDKFNYHEVIGRPKILLGKEDLILRQKENQSLQEIFYAGSDKRSEY